MYTRDTPPLFSRTTARSWLLQNSTCVAPLYERGGPLGRARSLVRHLVKVAEERVAKVDRHGAQREPSRLRRVAAQVERVDVVVAAGERADGNRLGT